MSEPQVGDIWIDINNEHFLVLSRQHDAFLGYATISVVRLERVFHFPHCVREDFGEGGMFPRRVA